MPETAGALAPRSHETEDAQVRVLRDALGKRLDGFAKRPALQGWHGHMAEYAKGQPMTSVRTFIADATALAASL